MELNTNYSQRVVLDTHSLPWVASPQLLVERKLIERDGGEVARATSIVRYRAGAQFPSHVHDLGEEIFVLDGVFSDEHGQYAAGSYLRNPPGSSHHPGSRDGCSRSDFCISLFGKAWRRSSSGRTSSAWP